MTFINWSKRFQISLVAVCALMIVSTVTAGASQSIDTSTPESTQESNSGGVWSVVAGQLGSGRSTPGDAVVSGDVYVLPSSGVEVVVGTGAVANDPVDSGFEDQIIINTDDGLGAVAAVEGRERPEAYLRSYVGGFGETVDSVVEIDVESSRYLATGVFRVESGSSIYYMYISVDSKTLAGFMIVEVIIADDSSMEASIVQLRENVTINGIPMFDQVDEGEVVTRIHSDEEN